MPQPDDPFAPPSGAFAEPWHAEALALADALVRAGHVSAADWAEALGARLAAAEAAGAADTEATYFAAVVEALEIVAAGAGIASADQTARRDAWADAYRRTPHGQPVTLGD